MPNMQTLTKLIHCNGAIHKDSHKEPTLLGLTKWDARYIYFLNKQLFLFLSLVCQGRTLLQASMMPTTQLLLLFVM